MSEKVRIPLAEAERLATELVELLSPVCERIEVAGSSRRRKATVGDVEIVCIPMVEAETDMFGLESGGSRNLFDERCEELVMSGQLDKRRDIHGRPHWGARSKAALYRGFACDLFAVLPPAQFGTIFLIRTGSSEFSHRLVTQRRQGGCMPEWMQQRDGLLWSNGSPVPTPEEGDVFAALGLSWVEPAERTDSWRPAGLGTAS